MITQQNISASTPMAGRLFRRRDFPRMGSARHGGLFEWHLWRPGVCRPNAGRLLVNDGNGYWAGFQAARRKATCIRSMSPAQARPATSATPTRASSPQMRRSRIEQHPAQRKRVSMARCEFCHA